MAKDDKVTTTDDMQKEFEAILTDLEAAADQLSLKRSSKAASEQHALQSLVDLRTLVKFRDLASTLHSTDFSKIAQ